jgi:hypothetical protein
MGKVSTVLGATPAYYFYIVNSKGAALGNFKISNVTVLSDTSFKFVVPANTWDSAFLMYLNVRMCGTASIGYSYSFDKTDTFPLRTGSLPVSYLRFEAKSYGQQVLLHWATSQEQNARNFLVQHSKDGIQWTSIGNVSATGNSASIQNYQFTHKQPSQGVNYYRILQQDQDSRSSYSDIRSLNFSSDYKLFKVTNNPVINGNLNVDAFDKMVLILNGVDGRLFWKQPVNKGSLQISVAGLPNGIYYLSGLGQTEKIVIKN